MRGDRILNSPAWILSSLLGLGAVGALFWLFGAGELLGALSLARPGLLLLYLALAVAVLLGYCARWRLVAAALGGPIPWRRLVEARLAGDAVGWLVPSARLAGEPVRVRLAMRGGLSGPQASAGVAIDRILEMLGNLVAVLVYVSLFSLSRAGGSMRFALVAAVTLGFAALASIVPILRAGGRPLAPLYGARARRALPRWAGVMDALRSAEEDVGRFFRLHPAAFLAGLGTSLAVEVVIVTEVHVLLRAFAVEIEVPVLLMVLLGSGAARAAPAPGALGALETSQIAALTLGGEAPALGFVVGGILRLHETFWTALGLAVLASRGLAGRLLRSAAERDEVAA